MPIIFRCQNCDVRLTVHNKDAGQRSRCPSCGSVEKVPELPPRAKSRSERGTEAKPRTRVKSRPKRRRSRPVFRSRLRASADSNCSPPLLIPSIIGGCLTLVVVVGFAAFMIGRSERETPPPQEETVVRVSGPDPGPIPSIADLNEQVEPSIVRIDVIKRLGRGNGSGYVVDASGLIATNYHVIGGAIHAEVEFPDGTRTPVVGLAAVVPRKDIAILKINLPARPLKPLPLAKELPRKGDVAVAFGAPLGLSFSMSEGIVSGVRTSQELRDLRVVDVEGTWLQTTTPISPGNSGGPLINQRGELVGMNTMTLAIGQNLNFAISSLDVAEAMQANKDQLIALALQNPPVSKKGGSRESTPVGKNGVGSVSGTITFSGTAPELKTLVEKGAGVRDARICSAESIPDQSLVVNSENNGVANIFVYLALAPQGAKKGTPKKPAVLVQKGCQFIPRCLKVQIGHELKSISNDPVPHNIHTFPIRNRAVNSIIKPNDKDGITIDLTRPETQPFQVKCDIHPWMSAYVLALDHPYMAITDKDGKFEIKDLPVGTHTLKIWHEKSGYLDKAYEVIVEKDKPTEIKLEYAGDRFRR